MNAMCSPVIIGQGSEWRSSLEACCSWQTCGCPCYYAALSVGVRRDNQTLNRHIKNCVVLKSGHSALLYIPESRCRSRWRLETCRWPGCRHSRRYTARGSSSPPGSSWKTRQLVASCDQESSEWRGKEETTHSHHTHETNCLELTGSPVGRFCDAVVVFPLFADGRVADRMGDGPILRCLVLRLFTGVVTARLHTHTPHTHNCAG